MRNDPQEDLVRRVTGGGYAYRLQLHFSHYDFIHRVELTRGELHF
jgi:hypothetical protein